MPTYVAKDYNGFPVSIVLAKSLELAYAFWHGAGIYPHSTSEWTEADLEVHPTGVLPILKTRIHKEHVMGKGLRDLLVVSK